jgi:hypothetical protein
MPPRLICLSIIAFWTTMTGWLLYREVWPRFRAGEPPPYNIDLTEEVGADMVSWNIYQKDQNVGIGYSQVARLADRTFQLRSQFRFNTSTLKLPLLGGFDNKILLKKLVGVYHVNDTGELLGMSSALYLGDPPHTPGAIQDFELEVRGAVKEGMLEPKVLLGGVELPQLDFGKLQVPVKRSILNPMHLLNRVPGLRAGQHWRVPLLDPLGGQLSFVPKTLSMPELEASVEPASLAWNGADVACYRILYRKPGEDEVRASTWVRRRDGLVLRQEAGAGRFGFTIERVAKP